MKLKFTIFLLSTFFFIQCGKEQIEYYDTGEIFSKYQIQNDKKEGIERRYYQSGKLLSERQWKEGVIVDKIIHYYESGDTLEIQRWNNGVKQGKATQFYKDGTKSLEVNFVDNKRVGETIFYSEDGIVQKVDIYNNDGLITHAYNYDTKGNLMNDEPFLILEPHTDTLLFDQDNKFEARFLNMDSSISAGFNFGSLDSEKNLIDTLDITEKIGNKYFIHIHPDKKGDYHLTGLYYYEIKGNGDTLSIGHVFAYDRKFIVK